MTRDMKPLTDSGVSGDPPAHPPSDEDRRGDPRHPIERPCRVASGGRWICARGRTLNASRQGLLVCVESERAWEPGDTLAVAVDWRGHAVLGPSNVLEGKVVRVERATALTQRLAIQLQAEHAIPVESHLDRLAAWATPERARPTHRGSDSWIPARAA